MTGGEHRLAEVVFCRGRDTWTQAVATARGRRRSERVVCPIRESHSAQAHVIGWCECGHYWAWPPTDTLYLARVLEEVRAAKSTGAHTGTRDR